MESAQPFFETIVRPYRSLNLFGFRLLMGALIVVNAGFGAVMVARGAWPVTGFMGLDVLAVYIAFRFSYAQGAALERITIADQSLIVARTDPRGRTREWRCPSYWASVAYDDDIDSRGVLKVRSHGRETEVGAFLHPDERASLARELSDALRRARSFSAAGS